jgi:hypothetical protein
MQWNIYVVHKFYKEHRKQVKLSLCSFITENHTTKVCWGSGGIVPCIIYLSTRWRWAVSFTPRPLYPQGKNPWYSLGRRLSGPQSRSGRGGEEKNFQSLTGLELPIIQPVAYTTELPWLLQGTDTRLKQISIATKIRENKRVSKYSVLQTEGWFLPLWTVFYPLIMNFWFLNNFYQRCVKSLVSHPF